MAKKLTQTALEKKVTELTWIADESCPGLRARLSVRQGKPKRAFYYRYRDRGTGKRKILKVGDYPAMSIADARKKVNIELRPIADEGTDVKSEVKRKTRSEESNDTIAGLMPEYLEFCELAGLAPRTIANYEQYLRPLRFWWGDRHPKELTRADAQTLFFRVQKRGGLDKNGESTRQGGDRAAGHVHSSSRAFYTWLLDKQVVESNPWRGQKKMKDGESGISSEETALTDKKITKYLKALKGRDGLVFRLLLATGLRPHNVCEARWSEIKGNQWTIPKAQMKWKKGPDHVIYLSDYAMSILATLRKLQKGRPRYLFPADSATGHLHVDTLRWGEISPKVPRATVATLLQGLNCPTEVRSRIRHHSHQTKLGKAYEKHLYHDEAAQWWQRLGKHLETLEPG